VRDARPLKTRVSGGRDKGRAVKGATGQETRASGLALLKNKMQFFVAFISHII
jgi:hypothetical protein